MPSSLFITKSALEEILLPKIVKSVIKLVKKLFKMKIETLIRRFLCAVDAECIKFS